MKNRQILAFILMIFILNACTTNYTSTDYLEKVLVNLETIESASYNIIKELWFPGDTAASDIYYYSVKEYNNPSDTTIGSKFV